MNTIKLGHDTWIDIYAGGDVDIRSEDYDLGGTIWLGPAEVLVLRDALNEALGPAGDELTPSAAIPVAHVDRDYTLPIWSVGNDGRLYGTPAPSAIVVDPFGNVRIHIHTVPRDVSPGDVVLADLVYCGVGRAELVYGGESDGGVS